MKKLFSLFFVCILLISTVYAIHVTISNAVSTTVVSATSIPKYGLCYHDEDEITDGSLAVLKQIASYGSYWIRTDWGENGSDTPILGGADLLLWNFAKQNGLSVLPIIAEYDFQGDASTWDQWLALMKTYLVTSVNEAPDMKAWELLNEPEQSWWSGGSGTNELPTPPLPVSYAFQFIQFAYTYIKSVNPDAIVVAPAVAATPTGISYISSLINLGLLNYTDAISVHYYIKFGNTDLSGVESLVNGRKPIWITECGMQSSSPNTETTQNTFMQEYLNPTNGIFATDKNIQVIIWYESIDENYPPVYNNDDGWGICYASTDNFTQKLAYSTFCSYLASATALTANISPTSATLDVGQSQSFTSAVSGGTSPFTYQWYLNNNPVSGATSSSWTFTPNSTGFYNVYINVIDNAGVKVKSNTATVIGIMHGHDVAVNNVTSSKTVVGQGYSASISVMVVNLGNYTEAFNVTASIHGSSMITQYIMRASLSSGNYTTITFTWNTAGYPYGKYSISAVVTLAPGETNNWTSSLPFRTVIVTIPGDINGDGRVNLADLAIILANWKKTVPPAPANADITGSGIIGPADLAIVLANWKKTVTL